MEEAPGAPSDREARLNSADNHLGATHTACPDAATIEGGINSNDENGRSLEVQPTTVEPGKGGMVTRESEMVRSAGGPGTAFGPEFASDAQFSAPGSEAPAK